MGRGAHLSKSMSTFATLEKRRVVGRMTSGRDVNLVQKPDVAEAKKSLVGMTPFSRL